MGVLNLESSLLIYGISGFLFFAIKHIRKPGNHGKFFLAHFSWYGDYLSVWSTFLSILCDQDLTFKVLLKVINENLPLKLESSFFVIKEKIALTLQSDCFLRVF